MAKLLEWRQLLAPEYVKQIEDEIDQQFAEGWNAHARAVLEQLRHLPPPAEAARERRSASYSETAAQERTYPRSRAPRGTWPRLIGEVLKAAAPDGLPYVDLSNCVQEKAPEYQLARSSFNVGLEKAQADGKIRKDGALWFWIDSAERSAAKSEEHTDPQRQMSPFAMEDAAD